jgi:6-phosphogluconate dehydrogenase
MNKQIGFIGLGKMGQNMVLHLLEEGVDVVVHNRTTSVQEDFSTQVAACNYPGRLSLSPTVEHLLTTLKEPRIVIMMVSAGKPVDAVIEQLLSSGLKSGDTVIDAGNSFYKDTVRRQKDLAGKGITYIDSGTSGGLEGARLGACLMLGGDEKKVSELSWLWDAIAVIDGWTYMGPSGAGHFVKMVHNGVEYGIDQAIGEGFAMLEKSPYQLDLAKVAHNWTHGSVVRGWLVELLARALDGDGHLATYIGKAGGGETGRWTVETAKELGVAVPQLEAALLAREESLTKPTFATKVVSALRKEYGGHEEAK